MTFLLKKIVKKKILKKKKKMVQSRLSEGTEFIRLVSQRRWFSLYDLLENVSENDLKEIIKNEVTRFKNQPSLLHYACMFQPPLKIVEKLLKLDTQSISFPNSKGWMPFHVACNYAASDEILQFLMEQHPASVKHVDKRGKNALHLLFDNAHVSSLAFNMIVIAFPSSATMEDSSGISPLELALLNGKIDRKSINAVNRAVKREKEESGHTAIRVSSLVPGMQLAKVNSVTSCAA